MTRFDFSTFDVFTSTPFRGNPLAVFPDARGLDENQMQAIAREINYSETTFVLPPKDPDNTAEVRIFTPTTELPFAGHPNVGTGYALAQIGSVFDRAVGDTLRFEEKAGIVGVTVERDEARSVVGATIVAPQPLTVGETFPADAVAAMIGLDAASVTSMRHPPLFLSVGVRFLFAELPDLETLAAARPSTDAFAAALATLAPADGRLPLFLYVRPSATPTRLRARMFAPLGGISEDPATGSASAALGAYLASREPTGTEAFDLVVDQGVEMGRASRIRLRAAGTGANLGSISVSGACVEVMRGSLAL